MDVAKIYWSLYNARTERQIDELSYLQLCSFVESMVGEARDEWSAWHEGLEAWTPLDEFKEFSDRSILNKKLPPQPPALKVNAAKNAATGKADVLHLDFDNEATRAQISLDQKKYSDRRANRRFLQSYKVQIFTLGTAFLTETVDVSLGGMNLLDPLPEGTPLTFSAKLTNASGASLTIHCQRIADVAGFQPKRARFKLDADVESVLRTWLFNAQTE